jgi:DNA-directed RNA polymerase subunit M/transcription elongation factor TFIIS
MLKLKACPRCKGDLHASKDLYGEYRQCLQCGYVQDIQPVNTLFDIEAIKKEAKRVA